MSDEIELEEQSLSYNQAYTSPLTKGSIPKSIFSLAVPMMVTNAFGIVLELTDAFFVGRLGSTALAGVTMASVVIFFLATLGVGFGIGTTALVARSCGANDFFSANRIALQSFYLGIIVAVVIGITGYFLSPFLLSFLGAKGAVLKIADSYLRILFAGIFSLFLIFQASAVFQGMGDTVTPMKIMTFAAIINIVLDPLLIFGLLGFPRLESAGAALATVISRTIGSVVLIYIFFKGNKTLKYDSSHVPIDLNIMKKIFIIGFPGSIQMFLRSFSMVVLTKIVALFGPIVLAAYGVGGRLFHLFLFPGFAFGGAAAALVGQNLGAKKPERAYKSALISAFYYLIYLVFFGSIVFIFSTEISALFNPEPEFVKTASKFIKFVAAGSIFLSAGVIFSRAFQGAGKTVSPMIATGIALYAVQIPLAIYLSRHFNLSETGIWIANLFGGFANASLMAVLFFRKRWMK